MFGYLVAATDTLTEEQLARYKASYCGLCRSLRERHGRLCALTLNYDMTFLLLLLQSLYEPEEQTGEGRCLRHPKGTRQWSKSEVSAYAADMTVALAYLKCLDDWEDDGSLAALAEAKALEPGYRRLSEKYPRQCSAMESSIAGLGELEKGKLEEPDRAAAFFGELMSELFVLREDRWSETLRQMAHALGRFIYLMDACMDLDGDAFHNRYNPFRRYYGLADNERRFRDILKMQLGECVYCFDRLPLVQDAGLLKNILCVGLWTRFNMKYSGKES